MRKQCAGGVQEQSGRFDCVARYRDDAAFLPVQLTLCIGVHNGAGTSLCIMFDTNRMGLRSQFKLTSRFGGGNLGVER
ncbi:hypothetical protein D3C84_998800 [compost metagenome]